MLIAPLPPAMLPKPSTSAIAAVDLTVAGFPCYNGERIVLRNSDDPKDTVIGQDPAPGAYAPDGSAALPDNAGVDTTNLVHAADIWHSVKRHWTIEARRLVGAQRRGVQ